MPMSAETFCSGLKVEKETHTRVPPLSSDCRSLLWSWTLLREGQQSFHSRGNFSSFLRSLEVASYPCLLWASKVSLALSLGFPFLGRDPSWEWLTQVNDLEALSRQGLSWIGSAQCEIMDRHCLPHGQLEAQRLPTLSDLEVSSPLRLGIAAHRSFCLTQSSAPTSLEFILRQNLKFLGNLGQNVTSSKSLKLQVIFYVKWS